MRTASGVCVVVACVSSAMGQLNNPGFETGTASPGLPLFPVGAWAFDNHAFVTAENGITPAGGARMLKFLNSSPNSSASSLVTCDVLQIVDLTGGPWSALIATGTAVANGTVLVNRVPQNAAGTVDTSFGLRLWSFSSLVDAQSLSNPTATVQTPLVNSDNNPQTWEAIGASLALPVGTQYLAFYLYASENSLNEVTGTLEYHGHYADEADLRIVPSPGALALVAAGGLVGLRRRRE